MRLLPIVSHTRFKGQSARLVPVQRQGELAQRVTPGPQSKRGQSQQARHQVSEMRLTRGGNSSEPVARPACWLLARSSGVLARDCPRGP